MTADRRWREPREGFEFAPEVIAVSDQYQREKLSACGLDDTLFDGGVDPSLFIAIAIRAGITNGFSSEGNVNMVQKLIQHRPALLAEPLTVRGRIAAIDEVPRGQVVHYEVRFEDERGERVIDASRRSLRPDPARAGTRGAGDRPPPVVTEPAQLARTATWTLTPGIVKAYSSEGNSIHYDMAAAQRAGFRAPLIGGGMGVHYLMAHLWRERRPERFDLDIYFRRPIFWDDTFNVRVDTSDWRAIALERDGKILTEAAINALETRA